MCGLKRLTAEELAIDIERQPAQAKRTLEALVKAGLAQTHGIKHGRTYTLAAGVYQAEGAMLLSRGRWILAIPSMSSRC